MTVDLKRNWVKSNNVFIMGEVEAVASVQPKLRHSKGLIVLLTTVESNMSSKS